MKLFMTMSNERMVSEELFLDVKSRLELALLTIDGLQNQVAILNHIAFGTRSEKLKLDPKNMPSLFNDAEAICDNNNDSDSAERSADNEPKPGKKNRGKRKPLPAHLPRVRHEIDLSEAEKICALHGTPMEKIGEKITEKLEMVPAKVHVLEEVVFQYKCACCDEFKAPQKDPEPIPKSMATPSLLAHIVTSKFVDALPLYRQEAIFARYQIELPRTTMARWMIQLGNLVTPLINLMREEILETPVVHCDETEIQVLGEPDRKPEQKSYMWCLTRPVFWKPIILYSYYDNRGKRAGQELLDEFAGILVTDGLKTYESLSRTIKFQLAGCMAHIRRKFWEADKASTRASTGEPKSLAKEALAWIAALYKIEREAKNKDPAEILQLRQDKVVPVLTEFRVWLDKMVDQVLPKSLLGRAIAYALDQWEKATLYANNAWVPIDNNPVESAIRPFVIGRNNWLFAQTPAGADASAALYSLVESAKANGVDPFDYLCLIFRELPKANSVTDYEKLLPHHAHQHYKLNTFSRPK
jgi:transposase